MTNASSVYWKEYNINRGTGVNLPKVGRAENSVKLVYRKSAESATLGSAYWTTGTEYFLVSTVADINPEMSKDYLDPIDVEIAAMTEVEVMAVVDALFGSWKDKKDLDETTLNDVWGGWAKRLASNYVNETEADSI